MTLPMNPLLLDDRADEVIAIPFHDMSFSRQIEVEIDAPPVMHTGVTRLWDSTVVSWRTDGEPTQPIHVTVPVSWKNTRYDRMTVAFNAAVDTRVTAAVTVDGKVATVFEDEPGAGSRTEASGPLLRGEVTHVRLTVTPAAGAHSGLVALIWVVLGKGPVDPGADATYGVEWDPAWPALVVPAADRGEVAFARGLLFDASDLEAIRRRRDTPLGRRCYPPLKARAYEIAARPPESQIGPYLPFSDHRYVRPYERGRRMITNDAFELGFVALMEDDPHLIEMAVRYLMAMVHVRYWCVSAEHRAVGSAWNQRCFSEEMATSTVAILADWFDFALNNAARNLVTTSIWEKGLAAVDRDMMKWSYMHGINQGAWFCRARVLGGLMLEHAWPRTDGYADRAFDLLYKDTDAYVLDDGSIDEGMGYFFLTMQMVLPAFRAYAKARGKDVHGLLPPQIARSGDYFAAMSGTAPGRVMLDGDNASDRPVGDGLAILAGLYPGSSFERAAAAAGNDDLNNYLRQYLSAGPLALILGPDDPPEPVTAAPTFITLDVSGHLNSLRRDGGRSVQMHVTGCPANPSHSHRDKGAFTVELDGEPTLIDRGVVRYEDARANTLSASLMHNVVTPVGPDGGFIDQARPEVAVKVGGRGDEQALHAEVDLTAVWPGVMKRCARRIDSPNVNEITVVDEGELVTPGPIAFHLHARRPWQIDGKRATLTGKGPGLRVDLPWADRVVAAENSIDFRYEPVYHLTAYAPAGRAFSLTTTLTRTS